MKVTYRCANCSGKFTIPSNEVPLRCPYTDNCGGLFIEDVDLEVETPENPMTELGGTVG